MTVSYWYHSRTSFSIILQISCSIVIEYCRNREPEFALGAARRYLPAPEKNCDRKAIPFVSLRSWPEIRGLTECATHPAY